MEILQPPEWPRPRGYSNGIAAPSGGRVIAVAGQVGWDPVAERVVSADFAAQADRALANIVDVLRTAGATAADVVRLTWYVTDRAAYVAARRELAAVYKRHFGTHYPAMSVVFVAGLLEPGATVEIEATAVVP